MDELEGIPAALWRQVALAKHRLLMLDYDGTLAPFRANRDEAVPWPRSLELLRAIASGAHTSVAVVSGRPVAALARFLDPLDATLIGEHGWERRDRRGRIASEPLPAETGLRLDEAEAAARGLGLGARLERKRTGVVLHTRGLSAAEARDAIARCETEWRPRAVDPGSRLDRIDGGLELRARGHDKGTATRGLVAQQPPGTLAVYLGDDVSDEDAFGIVRERGFGVLVGEHTSATRARARLRSWEAVPAFLEKWLNAAGPRSA